MNVSDVQVGFVIILGTLASAFGSLRFLVFKNHKEKAKIALRPLLKRSDCIFNVLQVSHHRELGSGIKI